MASPFFVPQSDRPFSGVGKAVLTGRVIPRRRGRGYAAWTAFVKNLAQNSTSCPKCPRCKIFIVLTSQMLYNFYIGRQSPSLRPGPLYGQTGRGESTNIRSVTT